MTEAEWLNGNDLAGMMSLLKGRASERKRRLFACACCRWSVTSLDSHLEQVLRQFEAEADGKEVKQLSIPSVPQEHLEFRSPGSVSLLEIKLQILSRFVVLDEAPGPAGTSSQQPERRRQDVLFCSALREVFGNAGNTTGHTRRKPVRCFTTCSSSTARILPCPTN